MLKTKQERKEEAAAKSRDRYELNQLGKQDDLRQLLEEYSELQDFARIQLGEIYYVFLRNEVFLTPGEADMIARYAKEIGVEEKKWKKFISTGKNNWSMDWKKYKGRKR